MNSTEINNQIWYARPVFFVSDLDQALAFYVDGLSFSKIWHEGNGKGNVCQIERGGCEIILSVDQARTSGNRLFVELSKAEVEKLQLELAEKSIPWKRIWWGYDVLQLKDPDGNELLVCLENLL
jgi:catechol 2,3-dioxygenase-like lactoylglutathione lyase family enzyme